VSLTYKYQGLYIMVRYKYHYWWWSCWKRVLCQASYCKVLYSFTRTLCIEFGCWSRIEWNRFQGKSWVSRLLRVMWQRLYKLFWISNWRLSKFKWQVFNFPWFGNDARRWSFNCFLLPIYLNCCWSYSCSSGIINFSCWEIYKNITLHDIIHSKNGSSWSSFETSSRRIIRLSY
jgi:hypothetical protein